ncbi:MAG TPA: DinB family protein [Thermoanaerobaculia bacterium]|nr:DinB family protein [Thermoanaerobaculia bacterium]
MKYTAAERAELIDRYEKGPVLLREAFAKVPREAWNWRPGAGRWSIHEILAHCADAEANAAMRIRFLVAEQKPSIIGFDQDRWATVLDYHQSRIELALAAVEVMRAHTTDLLRRLPDEAWASAGTHTERGPYSAEDWLATYAEHLEKHAGQVERNLNAWRQEQTRPGIEPAH